jgi:hypothetical protein
MPDDPDLPRLPDGSVDFEALLSDPEIEQALWADSVPFWSHVDPDGALRRAFKESPRERKTTTAD